MWTFFILSHKDNFYIIQLRSQLLNATLLFKVGNRTQFKPWARVRHSETRIVSGGLIIDVATSSLDYPD